MTPFQKAGYAKDTKFKVLKDYRELRKGDIVTLDFDGGAIYPQFKTQDYRVGEMYLPSTAPYWELEELELYEEPKELTLFERAGYTKDTKFKVLVSFRGLEVGDIVTLGEDGGGAYPQFKTQDGCKGNMCLPCCTLDGIAELEVYEESNTSLQQRVTELEKVIEQLKEKCIV